MRMTRKEIEDFVRHQIERWAEEPGPHTVKAIADMWECDRQDYRDEKDDPCMGPCCGGGL